MGTGRGTGRAEKWCRCQCHPQPHALHGALPGRHRSPLVPTQAHLLRGPESRAWGERLFTSNVPIRKWRSLGGGRAAPNTISPACQGGHGGSQKLCAHSPPKQIQGPPRAGELPGEQTQRPPQCSCPSASHLPGSQRAEEEWGEEGPGPALTEDERLNVRLRRLRRRCFLRLLRWLR